MADWAYCQDLLLSIPPGNPVRLIPQVWLASKMFCRSHCLLPTSLKIRFVLFVFHVLGEQWIQQAFGCSVICCCHNQMSWGTTAGYLVVISECLLALPMGWSHRIRAAGNLHILCLLGTWGAWKTYELCILWTGTCMSSVTSVFHETNCSWIQKLHTFLTSHCFLGAKCCC